MAVEREGGRQEWEESQRLDSLDTRSLSREKEGGGIRVV